MAPTMFARRWRERVDAQVATEDELRATYWELLTSMRGGGLRNSPVLPLVSQPWRSPNYDWYSAAAFHEVVETLKVGWLVIEWIEVGEEPRRDKEQEANDRALKRLPAPFEAWFAGGQGDCDGWFSWLDAITVVHPLVDDTKVKCRFPPSGVPLEVGHTEPETTIWHLRREGGVARWPYGQSWIGVLLATTGPPPTRGWPLQKPTFEQGGPLVECVWPSRGQGDRELAQFSPKTNGPSPAGRD